VGVQERTKGEEGTILKCPSQAGFKGKGKKCFETGSDEKKRFFLFHALGGEGSQKGGTGGKDQP